MEGLIAVTYRCNAKCHMCNTWQNPTRRDEELSASDLQSLPHMKFANITGGEPFIRDDLAEIVEVVRSKAKRVVISTNGYFTDRVLKLSSRFPDLGFRVSLEGLPAANDELRGLRDGFDHGLRTLLRLRSAGVTDIGFGITLSDRNADDLLELYELADAMGLEFATAAVHNNFYFHKHDNRIEDTDRVVASLHELARRQLDTPKVKNWFRAWFNMGLANYVAGGKRLLPCAMGTDVFFVDPFGRVLPCNGMESPMGDLHTQTFDEIWSSHKAVAVRECVAHCDSQCWMIGSASPAMKKEMSMPALWILRSKLTGKLAAVGGIDARPGR